MTHQTPDTSRQTREPAKPPTWLDVIERLNMGDIAGARQLFNLGVAMNFGRRK